MSQSVVTDLDDGVFTVTLNEPDTMNALSPGVTQGIFDALAQANEDDAIRVLLLTGSGRGFCAGASVGGGGPGSAGTAPSRRARLDQRGSSAATMEAIANCEVPVIAAVNGPAVGAGFGIATCCDVRLMAESARMGSIFIKRGLASDYGVSYWLPKLVGYGRAMELMYSGELLGAQQCLDIGLANKVFADDKLGDEAQAYARMIADGPPLAYTLVRRMMLRSNELNAAEFAEYEWGAQLMLLKSDDVREGFKAFAQKRAPEFKGQ